MNDKGELPPKQKDIMHPMTKMVVEAGEEDVVLRMRVVAVLPDAFCIGVTDEDASRLRTDYMRARKELGQAATARKKVPAQCNANGAEATPPPLRKRDGEVSGEAASSHLLGIRTRWLDAT